MQYDHLKMRNTYIFFSFIYYISEFFFLLERVSLKKQFEIKKFEIKIIYL